MEKNPNQTTENPKIQKSLVLDNDLFIASRKVAHELNQSWSQFISSCIEQVLNQHNTQPMEK